MAGEISGFSLEELEREVSRRKTIIREQEEIDQGNLRQFILDGTEQNNMLRAAILRSLRKSVGKSDLELFFNGHHHKFNVDIQITYCKENAGDD